MKFSPALYVCALALLPATARAQPASNGLWTKLDSWYRPVPKSVGEDFGYDEKNEVSNQDIRQVSVGRWPLAQQMLAQQSVVPLSIHQAQGLTATKVKMPSGRTPFLVRAVYLNAGTGAFSVFQKGTQIIVFHGSLGGGAVPMGRQALVVFLKKRPTQLFAEVSMAG